MNWEGPYQVIAKIGDGAYKLETLSKAPIQRNWNAMELKMYFSWTYKSYTPKHKCHHFKISRDLKDSCALFGTSSIQAETQ